jgi:hypothetical protein
VVGTSLGGSLFREWTHPCPGEPIPRLSATSLGGSLFREWTHPFPGEPIPRLSATIFGGRLLSEWTQPFTGEPIPRSRGALEDRRGRESRRTRVGGARIMRRGRKGYHGLSEKTISSLGRPTGNPTVAFSPVPALTAPYALSSPVLSRNLELRRSLGAVYSIATFIRDMSTLLQIRQVAHLRSTTCNLQGLSPTQRSTQTTPSRDLTALLPIRSWVMLLSINLLSCRQWL